MYIYYLGLCSKARETIPTIQITDRFTVIGSIDDRQLRDHARARRGTRVRVTRFILIPCHEIIEHQTNIIVIIFVFPTRFVTFDLLHQGFFIVISALSAPLLQKYTTKNPIVSTLQRALHIQIHVDFSMVRDAVCSKIYLHIHIGWLIIKLIPQLWVFYKSLHKFYFFKKCYL